MKLYQDDFLSLIANCFQINNCFIKTLTNMDRSIIVDKRVVDLTFFFFFFFLLEFYRNFTCGSGNFIT
jgi:hypothetical protein